MLFEAKIHKNLNMDLTKLDLSRDLHVIVGPLFCSRGGAISYGSRAAQIRTSVNV